MFYAYVLKSLSTGKRYYGSSYNPEGRLAKYHNAGLSKHTKKFGPWVIIHKELFKTRAEAVRREKFFKSGKGREYLNSIIKV